MAGTLIAIWSPKGGVGKTVIATGLAMHLARRFPEGVALVDLDAGKADVAPLLKVSLRPSILEYADGDGRTVTHPTTLKIIPGPPRLIDETHVTGDLTRSVLRRVAGTTTAAVIDLDADLRDSTVVTLEQSNAVLLVTTPDLLSIYAARRFVQEAEMVGIDLGRFRLVINRVAEKQEIPDGEILSLIGLGLAGRIPDLPGLTAAINRGMISTTVRQNTDFAISLALIADRLTFAGLQPDLSGRTRAATRGAARPTETTGLIPALKRWWQSL